MKKLILKSGQSVKVSTINGDFVIEQKKNLVYPDQVFFYVRNLDGKATRIYALPLTGIPNGMEADGETK